MTLSPMSMTALALACFMTAASTAQAAPARDKTAAVHQKKAARVAPQAKAPAARSDESWMDRASNPSNSGGGGGGGY